MPTKKNIDYMDIEVLAAHLCGKSEDDERDDIEDAFLNKFDVTVEQFEKLIEAMWPLLHLGISPLTETAFIGFSNEKEKLWLMKKDVAKQFVNSVVYWLGGDELRDSGQGRQRDISKGGKVEFEITIVKA